MIKVDCVSEMGRWEVGSEVRWWVVICSSAEELREVGWASGSASDGRQEGRSVTVLVLHNRS